MIGALALLLAQAPVVVPAAPPTATAPVSSEARAFAEAYVPAEVTARRAVILFRIVAAKTLAQQPAIAALEQRNPGARAKMLDAGTVEIEDACQKGLPALHQQIAMVAGAELSAAELRSITQYLLSPNGKGLQRVIAANAEAGTIATAVRTSGALTRSDLIGSLTDAGLLQKVTSEQMSSLAQFAATDAGRQFQTVLPKIEAAVTDETNKLVKAAEPTAVQAMMMTMRSLAAPVKGK